MREKIGQLAETGAGYEGTIAHTELTRRHHLLGHIHPSLIKPWVWLGDSSQRVRPLGHLDLHLAHEVQDEAYGIAKTD